MEKEISEKRSVLLKSVFGNGYVETNILTKYQVTLQNSKDSESDTIRDGDVN